MTQLKMRQRLLGGMFLLAGGLAMTSCIDDSYDLSEDMDMTMELGTKGLAVKLGNSEKIFMRDILEIDDETNIDTLPNSLYYLVEEGNTDFSFNIDPVSATIDPAHLTPQVEIVNFDKVAAEKGAAGVASMAVSRGETYSGDAEDATSALNIDVTGISDDIKRIKEIIPRGGKFRLTMEVIQTPGTHFRIREFANVKLHLPGFAESSEAPGQIFEIGMRTVNAARVDLGTFDLDRVVLPGELGQEIVGGELKENDQISMTGHFTFEAEQNFEMRSGDHANVRLTVSIDGNTSGQIDVAQVKGVFDPDIEPVVDPIDIGQDLPDFLQDERVTVKVSNPTVRFDVDMNEIPADINFRADLTSYKASFTSNPAVSIPGTGTQPLFMNASNRVYFYQGSEPFDPDGVSAAAQKSRVDNLSSLIEKLPDEIRVDLGSRRVRIEQNKLYTIELGRTRDYNAAVDYKVLVPMSFDAGLRIVYNDSIEDMNDDLKDYEADGVTLTANALNTVPLDLNATMKAYGVDGRELPSVEITNAVIPAATAEGPSESQLTLTITLANRADLRKLDKIKFSVDADADASGDLLSSQYLQLNEMRVRLNGTITGDFN